MFKSPSTALAQNQVLIRKASKDERSKAVKKLNRSLHHISSQNEILRHEIKGLKNALVAKKKQQKKSYSLDLQNNQDEYHGGAVSWSPRKLRQAKERKAAEDNEMSQLQLQKAEISKSKEQARLSKLQAAQDKRVGREKKKEAREKEKAEKAADRDSKKKAIQKAQNSKRKASKSSSEGNKRQKHVVTATIVEESSGATPAPTPVTTRSGRNIKVPSKYK
ncbi:hypothetical protein P3342_004699 [Pyrenophora teres f. teres]|uniref:TolA n=1 Tax=Pyrenophora teres f. teres TaxID=97479 RepID=A0A6S6VTS7_9PLEO|nr:hypothetical protein P3342_004699 [Pyrenophora teres f. teres]CAE7021164.1 hypothetical protein PTTW11_03209 [Pyrenophora teres f. teres]